MTEYSCPEEQEAHEAQGIAEKEGEMLELEGCAAEHEAENEMEYMDEPTQERIICPICKKDVPISFPGEIIHRHKSAINQLNGAICSASGRALTSLKGSDKEKMR